MHFQLAPMEIEEVDEEQRRTLARQITTYSPKAMKAAVEVDRIFVAHRDFVSTVKAFDRVFQLGRELSVPQGVSLIGPPGSGKTSLLRYFQASLPQSSLFETGLGVLTVRLPERPSLGPIVSALLKRLRYPFPSVSHQTVGIKRGLLVEALANNGTRLIGFDEAGHMCGPGVRKAESGKSGNEVTEFIRELIDEAHVAVALCGDEQLASLDRIDAALGDRVTVRQRMSDFASNEIWSGLLAAFARQCTAFDISFICQDTQPATIHKATRGNARRTKALLVEAVLIAVDKGLAVLNDAVMGEAFAMVNGSASLEANPWRTPALTNGTRDAAR